ncbi:hypothetical protein D3C72_2448580 [compost metagenome]
MIQADTKLVTGLCVVHVLPEVLAQLVPGSGRVQQQVNQQLFGASSSPAAQHLRIIKEDLK